MALTRVLRVLAIAALFLAPVAATAAAAQARPTVHRHFKTAIYIAVGDVKQLADRAVFDREFNRASSQLRFDKVWIEAYRDRVFATDAELEQVKRWFHEKGVETAGGITLAAGGEGGQFGTFDYEKPEDRSEAERAVRLTAKHFDEVILDDFFFYTSKSDADIAAKGNRSWTQYRIDKMREVSRDLVLGPAKQVNPRVRMIIKYPNWYEHFHGLGYDLAEQPKMFDAIYSGTETRDPVITDQLLQQYESYGIFRYLANIRPDGGNLGGWVDTFSTRSVDRYAEQLWDTLFAKAPEITLFNWSPMSEAKPLDPGTRPWAGTSTSFNWDAIARAHPGAGWGTAANSALELVDAVLGELGKPVGVASYRPPHATGEDFLHNYIGNLGIPIELYPAFPSNAATILLTESAAANLALARPALAQSAAESKMPQSSVSVLVEPQLNDGRLVLRIAAKNFGTNAVAFGPSSVGITKPDGQPVPIYPLSSLVDDVRVAAGLQAATESATAPTQGAYAAPQQTVREGGQLDVTGFTGGSAVGGDEYVRRSTSSKTKPSITAAEAEAQITALKQA